MSEKPVAYIKTLARYEPDTVYIGSGEYVAECVRADDGDYYLAADVDAAIEALRAEVAEWKGIAVAQSAEIERLQAEVETGDYNWNRFIEPINSYFVYKPGFVIRPESARESEGGPYASHPCGAAKNIMCYVDALEDRAERLAEALRLIESAKDRGFGIDYARGVAQRALLRDQEGGQ